MWTGCSIGDGEEIKGYEDGGPPTLCQPASQQGGGEEVNNLAGGAWRGLEVCWGRWENFWSLHFLSMNLSPFSCEPEIGRVLPGAGFWPGGWERKSWWKVKVFHSNRLDCCILLSVLDTVL